MAREIDDRAPALVLLFYRVVPEVSTLLVPLVVFLIVLLTLGLGFLVAIMNAIVRDIGNILTLAITLLMYLTPVLYAKPKIGILSQLTQYNPMYHFVAAGRDLILSGRINDIGGFLFSALF